MGIFEKALVEGNDITDYIPQRHPFVMVDKFYGISDLKTYSSLTILSSNVLCEKNVFSEAGIMEHIAQSVAVSVGYACKNRGIETPMGFIASVNKAKFHSLPKVGDVLDTEVRLENKVDKISIIFGVVKCGEKIIAESQMKIFVDSEENLDFL